MNKKTDYVAWGLDEATPGIIEESMEKREKIFNKIKNKLDWIATLMLISTGVQVTLAYIILTKI
jgi:hypothetical protein